MTFTDDPAADFERYDAEQQAELDKLPKCEWCGERIQTEECYEVNNELICPECLNENYRRWVDDYIE